MSSVTYKPIPFYFLNTTDSAELSREAAKEALLRLKRAGYGGAMLFNKPPDGFSREAYLSDAWFEAVGNFLEAASGMEMEIWLNDGWDFPPGDVAGRIEKIAPELKQRRMRRNADGTLEVVECPWGFPAFEEPESSRLFIQMTYEEYYRRFAKYFGNALHGFFSDGDNRRSSHFTRSSLAGSRYYPWPRNFEETFKKRYGYDILPKMNAVIDETDASACENYWEIVSELYHNWFKNNQEWCHAHGLEYTFHTSDTGPLTWERCDRSSVYTEGETLRLLSFSDRPGTDHELACLDGGTHYDKRYHSFVTTYGDTAATHPDFSNTFWDLRAKMAASAAWLNHNKRVLCEAFAATNWNSSAALMKRIAAWQLMQGVNFFVPHAVHHRFRGDVKFFAPPEQTMVPGIAELNAFIEHFCFVASQGEYADPVRIADPTRSIWRGEKDDQKFYSFCDKLNRQAVNYVIVPEGMAADKEVPAPYASFDGGELAWMLRRLEDGTRYLLAANIWSDDELTGAIRFDGHVYQVALSPGEIAILGGPWECYRRPLTRIAEHAVCAQEDLLQVTWGGPNLVPLFSSAVITVKEEVGTLHLQVPHGIKANIPGIALTEAQQVHIWDDLYDDYAFTPAPGEYFIELGSMMPHTHAYLAGDFDLATERPLYGYYELTVTGPCLELTRRRQSLTCTSWTLQGHPFYSGQVTYHLPMECNGEDTLEFPVAGGVISLQIDSQPPQTIACPPYRFSIPDMHGHHNFHILVENTLSNRLDAQSPASGLLAVPMFAKTQLAR